MSELKIQEIPEYVWHKYGLEISRQTAYNWTTKGLRNEKLKVSEAKGCPTAKHPLVRVTTPEWIDEFIRRCGVECPGAPGSEDPGPAADPQD